jgi:hypothetical protein
VVISHPDRRRRGATEFPGASILGSESAAADADAFLLLEFCDEIRAHFSMSLMAHAPAPRFRVHGTKAAYVDLNDDPLNLAGKPAVAGCLNGA